MFACDKRPQLHPPNRGEATWRGSGDIEGFHAPTNRSAKTIGALTTCGLLFQAQAEPWPLGADSPLREAEIRPTLADMQRDRSKVDEG